MTDFVKLTKEELMKLYLMKIRSKQVLNMFPLGGVTQEHSDSSLMNLAIYLKSSWNLKKERVLHIVH